MNSVLPLLAIAGYFTPMIMLVVRGLWGLQPHLLFASYWLLNGTINTFVYLQVFEPETNVFLATGLNLIDFPIVALGVYSIAKSRWVKFVLLTGIPVYVIAAIYAAIKYSLEPETLINFIPIAITIIVVSIVVEIFYYFQKVEHTKYETSIIFILGSIIFHYLSYILIYLFENHFPEVANVKDIYTIYYFSSIIAMLFAIMAFSQRSLFKQKN
jgi:hypothetical protein